MSHRVHTALSDTISAALTALDQQQRALSAA
jgi:hypothetical protein